MTLERLGDVPQRESVTQRVVGPPVDEIPEDLLAVLDLDPRRQREGHLGDRGNQREPVSRLLGAQVRAHGPRVARPGPTHPVEEPGLRDGAGGSAQRVGVAVVGRIGDEEDEIGVRNDASTLADRLRPR
jgi:hypothetical protein